MSLPRHRDPPWKDHTSGWTTSKGAPHEAQIGRFVEYYNHQRYHESLENLTPADVYFGRGQAILQERHRIKQKTIEHRRLLHRKLAA